MASQFAKGDKVEPKDEFLNQFHREDRVRNLFISGDPAKGHKTQDTPDDEESAFFWVELMDDAGNKVVGAFGNTLFSTNWIKRA